MRKKNSFLCSFFSRVVCTVNVNSLGCHAHCAHFAHTMRSESLKTFRPAYWTGQERDRNRKGERKAETSRARDRLVLFMPCILPPSSSPVPPSYSWYPLCLPGLFLVEAHKFAQTTRHSAATWSKLIRRLAAGNGAHWQATNKTNRKASTMSLSSVLCPVSYVSLLFLFHNSCSAPCYSSILSCCCCCCRTCLVRCAFHFPPGATFHILLWQLYQLSAFFSSSIFHSCCSAVNLIVCCKFLPQLSVLTG